MHRFRLSAFGFEQPPGPAEVQNRSTVMHVGCEPCMAETPNKARQAGTVPGCQPRAHNPLSRYTACGCQCDAAASSDWPVTAVGCDDGPGQAIAVYGCASQAERLNEDLQQWSPGICKWKGDEPTARVTALRCVPLVRAVTTDLHLAFRRPWS